jgi:hypothetical protein
MPALEELLPDAILTRGDRLSAEAERLLAAWFRADGSRCRLAPGEVEAWFDLVDGWRSGAMA